MQIQLSRFVDAIENARGVRANLGTGEQVLGVRTVKPGKRQQGGSRSLGLVSHFSGHVWFLDALHEHTSHARHHLHPHLTHTHTHTQTDRQTHTHTHTHPHAYMEKEAYKHWHIYARKKNCKKMSSTVTRKKIYVTMLTMLIACADLFWHIY